MAERRYTVVGPHTTLGHGPGETFDYTLTTAQESYYMDAGHLALAKDAKKPDPLHCEQCVAHGKPAEKKATYKDLLALREHYSTDHPGLAAPTE